MRISDWSSDVCSSDLCRAYRFTQLMETDCVPAKADWVTDLDAICSREPFWIAGAFLHDLGAVNGDYAFHLNGNALYATGDQQFPALLDSTFITTFCHLILDRRPLALPSD